MCKYIFYKVYIHEIKEALLSVLIVIYTFSVRFISEDSTSPYFWLSLKLKDIIDKAEADNVSLKLN